jgi:PiT family inorganic phosphate transporter
VYRRIRDRDPDETRRSFRIGQIASASLVALSHGTNDAQKTMGVITLALIANGDLERGAGVPTWVVIADRHQPRDLRRRMAHHPDARARDHEARDPAGLRRRDLERRRHPRRLAGRLPALDHAHHVRRRHGRRGRQARRRGRLEHRSAHAFAWLLTVPAAGVIAGACYLMVDGIGGELAGPLAVSVLALVGASALFAPAQRTNPVTAQDV